LRVGPSAQPNSHRKSRFEQWPIREVTARTKRKVGLVSAVAVIVVIVVALLLASVLVAALRRDARHAHHGPSDDPSFRSHAEASRSHDAS
jgi:hypothetical protein